MLEETLDDRHPPFHLERERAPREAGRRRGSEQVCAFEGALGFWQRREPRFGDTRELIDRQLQIVDA